MPVGLDENGRNYFLCTRNDPYRVPLIATAGMAALLSGTPVPADRAPENKKKTKDRSKIKAARKANVDRKRRSKKRRKNTSVCGDTE